MSDVPDSFRQTQERDFPYFRRIWNRVVAALMAASFIPLILIGGGMYYYAISIMKEKALETLRMEVKHHKETIDQFLAERAMDLKVVSANLGLNSIARPEVLRRVFLSLRSVEGRLCFMDLGIIDEHGKHLAYAGPFDLISKNYKDAEWFESVMERDVYISDVFLGFRDLPHFIIAVKQVTDEGTWIIRGTVDASCFDMIASRTPGRREGNSFLVNRKGFFQTNPAGRGRIMEQSEFKNPAAFKGIQMKELDDRIRATAWLKNVPWLCVVEIDRSDIFASLKRVRNIGLFVFILGSILIIFTVLLTTNQLVSILEEKRRSIRFLDKQLRRTSYMASLMELSDGFLGEINDTLANIDIAATWVQDPAVKGDSKEIETNLDQIKSEVSRSRKSIDRFIRFIRQDEPVIIDIDINDLLNDLMEFMSSELRLKKISVKYDYEDGLPNIRSDRSKLRQVFQNIVLNAMTAVEKDGEIIITTRAFQGGVTVTITDNGTGIPEENMENIFDPLFTTKQEGAGLGLTICRNILQKLGGHISVKNEPERGASFTVEIPLLIKTVKT